jgi:hypothetical protein
VLVPEDVGLPLAGVSLSTGTSSSSLEDEELENATENTSISGVEIFGKIWRDVELAYLLRKMEGW